MAALCWSSCEEIPHVQGKRNQSKTVANLITWTTALSSSMKLSHALLGQQGEQVMVEMSDIMWSTGEENGKSLQYSRLENPMNSMKRQNDEILKEELPR